MKKRILYIAAFMWMLVILALVVADGLLWSNERRISSFHDGCVAGSKVYVTENIDGEGVLYVSDLQGKVEKVFLSSSIRPGSTFGKVDYQDGLYGVLLSTATVGEETVTEYRIVQFDDRIHPVAVSPGLHMAQAGVLTGFQAETGGFYLTMVSDGGKKACVYFVDRQKMTALSEGASPTEESPALEIKFYELVDCEEGRLFVEAGYEEGELLIRRDNGDGAEYFQKSPEVQNAFRSRNLTVGQLLKLRQERFVVYIQILLIGYAALFLLFIVLRNRSHVVYTIAIVETVLLAITAAGVVQIPRLREKAEEQESERFGFYYVQTLAERIGNPVNYNVEEEGFYNSREYYSLRNQLCGFAGQQEISRIFADVCIVRSSDHQILVSASGFNRQRFEEVYVAGTGDMLDALAAGEQTSGMVMRIDGEAYKVLGVSAAGGLYPEYLLIGITRMEDSSFWKGGKDYLIYAEILFLIGSVVSISLLIMQGRELKRLAKAMDNVANGQMEVVKKSVHGKDVDYMWNSLLEIKKTISQINYTKFRIFESCYRFAPKNIEKILGKDSITEVKSGDMAPVYGTVASIFSAELENRDRRSAQVMNRFFKLIEKHQDAGDGYIVSGHSDLTMLKVLFLDDSRNTVEFESAFMRELCEDGSLEGLKTGVFLHYAQYVYGVAGTEQQSFPFLLSREGKELEKYARWLQEMGLRLVITESVKSRENPEGNLRYIGYILISDTGEKLRLYEVLDACPLAQRRLKTVTDVKFQKALQLFYQHDFYLARSTFSDVLKDNPEDAIAKWYLFTCEKYLNQVHIEGDICRLYWEA
ncbi:MAG: hypothetical protein K2K63_08290 [Acetatifactor sp.]|nr:hypothetical protein [Acetatifactor sp.]